MSRLPLGELLAKQDGSIKTGPFGTALKAAEYSRNGVPVISVGEIGYGSILVKESTPRVDGEVVRRLHEYVLKAGDVVFGRKGAVDRSAWVREEESGYFLGSDGIRVRFGHGVSTRFMAYQLASRGSRDWLLQHAAGTTMASLNQRILERLPVVVLPLAEQTAIAEVLGALDDKIAANDRVRNGLDELCALEVDRASRGGEVRQLREVMKLNYGKSLPASRREAGDAIVYGSGGPSGRHSTSLVDRAGVIVGRKGTVGAVYWADGPHFPIDTTFWVESLDGFDLRVLYYLLRRMALRELNSDSAVPGLNRDEAYAQLVGVPHERDMLRLGREFEPRFALMAQLGAETDRLARTRDELLPLLMSGKVRVQLDDPSNQLTNDEES